MTKHQSGPTYSIKAGALIVALAVLSFLPIQIPPPEAWLIAWTEWLAVAIGIAVAAKGIWVISLAAAHRIRNDPEA
jgi:hypothetical protein